MSYIRHLIGERRSYQDLYFTRFSEGEALEVKDQKNPTLDEFKDFLTRIPDDIRFLSFINCPLTPEMVRILVAKIQKLKLIRLKFSWCDLNELSSQILFDGLKNYLPLRELNLGWNNFSSGEPIENFLISNSNLQELDISGNDLGDLGARKIAHALTHNQNLRYLNITFNQLTLVGMKILIESYFEIVDVDSYTGVRFPNRRVINLNENIITKQDYYLARKPWADNLLNQCPNVIRIYPYCRTDSQYQISFSQHKKYLMTSKLMILMLIFIRANRKHLFRYSCLDIIQYIIFKDFLIENEKELDQSETRMSGLTGPEGRFFPFALGLTGPNG